MRQMGVQPKQTRTTRTTKRILRLCNAAEFLGEKSLICHEGENGYSGVGAAYIARKSKPAVKQLFST